MRKKNLKIQMLAGNSLNSYFHTNSKDTMPLVKFLFVSLWKETLKDHGLVSPMLVVRVANKDEELNRFLIFIQQL